MTFYAIGDLIIDFKLFFSFDLEFLVDLGNTGSY